MFLRDLTDKEIEKIKKYKDSANAITKIQRKKLQAEIKARWKRNPTFDKKREALERQLEAHTVIIGRPVIVKVEDLSLCLNYDLLKKFERSLYKSNLACNRIKIEGKSLIIRYGKYGQSGIFELAELPTYQTELLTGLPTIDLKE